MGENKHLEEINAFTKKYIKEIPTETPSDDFTANLMKSITQLEPVKSVTTYKPLISKKGWFIVFTAIAALLFVPFISSNETLFALPELNFSLSDKIGFSGILENLSVSNTMLSITVVFGILVSIQIVYLKGFFEKRIY